MLCLPLQDFITIRSISGSPTVTQPESGWLDLYAFEDIIAFLDVKQFTNGGGTVTMSYEHAPTKDDTLFTPALSAFNLANGLTVTKMLMSGGGITPISRFLRWKLTVSGASSTWDATFRVWIAANMVSRTSRVAPDTIQRIPRPTPTMPLSPPMRRLPNGGATFIPAPPNGIGSRPTSMLPPGTTSGGGDRPPGSTGGSTGGSGIAGIR
jgi:hypothetical protein